MRNEVIEFAKARTREANPPGLVLVSIARDREDHLCSGVLSLDSPEPPTLNTLFEIGSNTKVFVALALARLVADGEVNLNDRAQDFLPDVRLPTRGNQHIRLVDLATHTAALPRMPDTFDYSNPWDAFRDYSLEDLYSFLQRVSLNWDIAGSYVYSNVGYGLLGHILERVTAKSYDTLIAECVCGPLGMDHTGLDPSGVESLVQSHQGQRQVPPVRFGALGPAGGLRSTANDLIKFISANLSTENELGALFQSVTTIRYSASNLAHMALGWHVQTRDERILIWHRGETLGQTSFVAFDPQRETGVLMLSNAAFGGCCCDLAVWQLDENVLPNEHQNSSVILVAASDLKRFEGTYAYQPQVAMELTAREDHLRVEVGGLRGGSMYPVATDEFITRDQRVRIWFLQENGKVVGFRLRQHGIDQWCIGAQTPNQQLQVTRLPSLRCGNRAPELECYAPFSL